MYRASETITTRTAVPPKIAVRRERMPNIPKRRDDASATRQTNITNLSSKGHD